MQVVSSLLIICILILTAYNQIFMVSLRSMHEYRALFKFGAVEPLKVGRYHSKFESHRNESGVSGGSGAVSR